MAAITYKGLFWCRLVVQGLFSAGEGGEWNRKISIAGVTWHLDAQPNGMLRTFARLCVYAEEWELK